jgi:hypothetical protein
VGPILLFDKSFLQSLSVDESLWLDRFFLSVICPLFFVETVADLHKEYKDGKRPEDVVSLIAAKSPQLSGTACPYHMDIVMNDLFGIHVPMDGRVPVSGGQPVHVEGKSGTVFEPSMEAKAFSRFQRGRFEELDRQFARGWREALANMNLDLSAQAMRPFGIDAKSVRSLEEAMAITLSLLEGKDRHADRLRLALTFAGVPMRFWRAVQERWAAAGWPPFRKFAPYAAHVATVETFMHVALAANLISSGRASNRVDIAYLFYLPFCHAFTSCDNLHEKCAPLFLREDQQYIRGTELKAGLSATNAHFAALPENTKELGIMAFALAPPEGLLAEMWDRHCRLDWRDARQPRPPRDPEKEKELLRHLKAFAKAPSTGSLPPGFDPNDQDVISLARNVSIRKGNWWQLPKRMMTERQDGGDED